MNHIIKFKSLKNKANSEELLERRLNQGMHLKRKRREEQIEKHRKIRLDDALDDVIEDVEMLDVNKEVKSSMIEDNWIKLLYSNVIYDQLNSVAKILKHLFKNPLGPQEIMKLEVVPRLLEILVLDFGASGSEQVQNYLKVS